MTAQIDVDTLANLLSDPQLRIVDGSWALDGTDMHSLYRSEHIPGAVFFDLEAISDHSTSLPHMAPSPVQFAAAVGALGINQDHHVVIYDRQGLFSAARVWWTFRLMGHEKVQVLKGGLPAWKAAGNPVSGAEIRHELTQYAPQVNSNIIINISELKNFNCVTLDARSHVRFTGEAPEPRPGLRSGHMPGSQNLPFTELIKDGALKPRGDLEAVFARYDLGGMPIVTSCGSGVTAAILSMALCELGRPDVRLYDGSWAEWGQECLDTPVVTGDD